MVDPIIMLDPIPLVGPITMADLIPMVDLDVDAFTVYFICLPWFSAKSPTTSCRINIRI